jgi:L-arabinonolactonase
MTESRIAHAAGNILGEGVQWDDRGQAVWWTDISGRTLWRLHPASGKASHWDMPERVASFALCDDPDILLLALASRLAFWRIGSGELMPLMDVEPGKPTRANDGACDRQGRFVFGTLHEPDSGPKQAVGGFYRLDRHLELEHLPLPGVIISNSIAFSPSGDLMYYCDSPDKRIMCVDYGDTLGEPRVFVDLRNEPGEPDGSTVDADGGLWNARWGAGRVFRYAPDGALSGEFDLPAQQPTRPAFGGPMLDRLYVTSASSGLDAAARGEGDGALHTFETGFTGLAEPRFAGAPPIDGTWQDARAVR